MRFFKRGAEDERLMTCPECSQLISAEATKCDMCGSDLHDIPAERRESGLTAGAVADRGNPYAR